MHDLYELAMFTRHKLDLDEAKEEEIAFGRAHSKINSILNVLAPYSEQATLNPRETCEFPQDMEGVGGKCLIFDSYEPELASKRFGVMLAIEVFRSEMDYARQHGGQVLIDKLKFHGHYPYSDLEREPVI